MRMPDKMEMCLITGDRIYLRPADLARATVHRDILAGWLVVLSGLILFAPHPEAVGVPTWIRIAVYFPAIILSIATFLFVVWLQLQITMLLGKKNRVHSSPAIMAGAISGMVAGHYLLLYFGVQPPSAQGWIFATIAINYLLGEAVLIFFGVVVTSKRMVGVRLNKVGALREYLKGGANDQKDSGDKYLLRSAEKQSTISQREEVGAFRPAAQPSIRVGSDIIPIHKIEKMQSKGGYVEVTTDNRNYTEISPLQEIALMIPNGFGYQVHRGYWVSFHSIKFVKKDGRNKLLILHDKSTIPVARYRQEGFKKAYALYLAQNSDAQSEHD